MVTTTVASDIQTIERDFRVIVGTEIALPGLTDLGSETKLSEVNFDTEQFLSKLDLEVEEAATLQNATFGDIISVLESKPAVHQKLGELATEARVRRLVMGVLLSTQIRPPANEGQRWWYELASQILWWYARQSGDEGLKLVQRGMPTRAVQSLTGLGLLELDSLAQDSDDNKLTFIKVLQRLEYPTKVAKDAYEALVDIAKKINQQYEGQIQRLLGKHSNQMVAAISQELLSDIEGHSHLTEAVKSWVSLTTNLPVEVWSPSTIAFVKKFAGVGVTEDMLTRVADDLGRDLRTIDDVLARFMDGLCQNCDPKNEEHQYCIKNFTRLLEVECPIHTTRV